MTAVPANPATTSSAGTRRTVRLIIAGLACVIGVALAFGGGALVVYDRTQRDSGYVTSDGEDYATQTYAFTTQSLDVPVIGSGGLARSLLGDVRITSDSSRPVFVGIARYGGVDLALHGVGVDLKVDAERRTDGIEASTEDPVHPPV